MLIEHAKLQLPAEKVRFLTQIESKSFLFRRLMTSHHLAEFDTDSVTSSPRSDHFHEPPPRVRFMCSFGGKILPRPHDNQLRYVGGDTRIVAIHRSISFSALLLKLFKLSGMTNITVKYQLPNEDLDALISVTTDEDVENMMDEYDRVARNQNSRSVRLRLFLFSETEPEPSRTNSISSLLNGSANRENWFLDALNGGVSGALERGRSEASSMLSEVPDYLFGLDHNSDETQQQQREPRPNNRPGLQDNVSNSDPGSPAPIVSSPFCSSSSAPSIPNLPPVKTKLANSFTESREIRVEAETGGQINPNPYPINRVVHYAPDAAYSDHSVQTIPVYYIPGPVQPGTVPVQPVPIQAPYPYVQQQPYHHAVGPVQVPYGYHHMVPGSGQIYGSGPGIRHLTPEHPYSPSAAMVHSGMNQHVYQAAAPNSGGVPIYSGMTIRGDEQNEGGAEFDGSGHQFVK